MPFYQRFLWNLSMKPQAMIQVEHVEFKFFTLKPAASQSIVDGSKIQALQSQKKTHNVDNKARIHWLKCDLSFLAYQYCNIQNMMSSYVFMVLLESEDFVEEYNSKQYYLCCVYHCLLQCALYAFVHPTNTVCLLPFNLDFKIHENCWKYFICCVSSIVASK